MEQGEFVRYVQEAFRQIDEGIPHPPIEQIAELAGGTIFGTAQQEIADHVSRCELCRDRLRECEQFLADCEHPAQRDFEKEIDDAWRKLSRRIWWHNTLGALSTWTRIPARAPKWAAVSLGVVLTAGFAWFGVTMLTPSPERLLAQAYNEHRTVEFRIADAAYAPMRLERGAGSTFDMPEPLLKAAARLAEEIRTSPDDPELLRLQGEAEMMAQEAGPAVETLEKALKLDPRNAQVLAGLGAAYALRGDLNRQPADYRSALQYLDRSLELKSHDKEVIFNRALVLERMQMKDQAILEWQRYLKLDNNSNWAAEARKHLASP